MTTTATSLDQLLETVSRKGSHAVYKQVARQLASHAERLQSIRIALLSTFTIDTFTPYLQVEAARRGFSADVYVAPFNTVRQSLLDPASDCLRHESEIVFVAQLLGDVCPELADDFLSLSPEQVQSHIDSTVADLVACLKTFRRYSSATVVVHNFPLPDHAQLGIYEPAVQLSQTTALRRLNQRLASDLMMVPGVYVLDFDRLCAEIGYRNWRDEKMWYLGRAPLSIDALVALAGEQVAFVKAQHSGQRKCLVVDLDNTLWGGIVGEDGAAGVELGHDYPGNVFLDVQRQILQLHRRGVLLAINSKNNLADVQEVFETRPEMLFKMEDFVCTRINWQPKPQNMLEISDELNIGLDSLVFLDDNPSECELMRLEAPEVLTLQGSDAQGRPSPVKSLQLIRETRAFDRLAFTAEDQRRGVMYRQQSARRQFERSATSLDDFLLGLQMRMRVRAVDHDSLPRVSQLILKTNQFNLTTRRYGAGQVEQFARRDNGDVFAVELTDRFGDNGIVGVAIVEIREDRAHIDTLLLSCRVIGRSLETALLSYLIKWAKERGASAIEGVYIPTAKNPPAADFYQRHGFQLVAQHDKETRWSLPIEEGCAAWPVHIQLEEV